MIDLKDFIRTIPDYPEPGVNFYDINSLFAQPVWNQCAAEMAVAIQTKFNRTGDLTHIVGIESRGFVVGAVLAGVLGVPFIMVRKKGAKYPGSLLEESYALEYGEDTLVLQEGILGHANRVLIADDLVATGGSLLATKRLVEQTGAKVIGATTIINLKYINKPDLAEFDVQSAWDIYE
jgi:adenine phosphoribosyltransferase